MTPRSQRPATLTTCRHCQTPVITGTDDYAQAATADPIPLTRTGELHAMAAGRDCWRLDADRHLWHTDRWRIRSDRPYPSDHRITAHHCHQPIPTTWTSPTVTREGELF